MDHATALEQTESRTRSFAGDGEDESARAAGIMQELFHDFRPETVPASVHATYAEDVWFDDTLKTIEGRDELARYLAHSASLCDDFQVIVEEAKGRDGDYLVRWRMRIKFKRFRKGLWTESIGVSHLRFDEHGRIIMHQDYWDGARGLFEHVPVLGWAIRKIKSRV